MQILSDETFERLVQVGLPTIDIIDLPVPNELQKPTAAKAEREVGAVEALVFFPDVEVMGNGVVNDPGPQVSDRHIYHPEKSGALVKDAVVIHHQVVGRLDHARGRGHPGGVETSLQDLFPQIEARLHKPRLIGGNASVHEFGRELSPALHHRVELDQGDSLRREPFMEEKIEEPWKLSIIFPRIISPHLDLDPVADSLDVPDDGIEGTVPRNKRPAAVMNLPRSVEGDRKSVV